MFDTFTIACITMAALTWFFTRPREPEYIWAVVMVMETGVVAPLAWAFSREEAYSKCRKSGADGVVMWQLGKYWDVDPEDVFVPPIT